MLFVEAHLAYNLFAEWVVTWYSLPTQLAAQTPCKTAFLCSYPFSTLGGKTPIRPITDWGMVLLHRQQDRHLDRSLPGSLSPAQSALLSSLRYATPSCSILPIAIPELTVDSPGSLVLPDIAKKAARREVQSSDVSRKRRGPSRLERFQSTGLCPMLPPFTAESSSKYTHHRAGCTSSHP